MVWEIVFMLLILKIPIVYLCVVVWYAIREEPASTDPAAPVRVTDTPPSGGPPHRSRRAAVRLPRRPSPAGRSGRPRRAALRTGGRR